MKVALLDVDSGIDTNRTVMTLVGDPKSISIAAFKQLKTSDLIDMSKHHGTHSRIGDDVVNYSNFRNQHKRMMSFRKFS